MTTVSPTHAHELRTPYGGFGLHDMFVALRDRFVGIVNGIDQRVWDPAHRPAHHAHYSAGDLDAGRSATRRAAARTGSAGAQTSRSSR